MADRLLVVDDDQAVRESLDRYLTEHGYRVRTAAEGKSMRRLLEEHAFDLVILDLMLGGEDGLELARGIRERSNLPIIMLTARGDEIDRIIGLEMGADDYLAKPYNPRELVARVKSVLRRARKDARSEATPASRHRFAGWFLDCGQRKLVSSDGPEVSLTSGEFDLLVAFVTHPQRVLSRDMLLDLMPTRRGEPFDRSVDVQVLRLRRKIEADPTAPKILKTVRGGGYVFTPAVESE